MERRRHAAGREDAAGVPTDEQKFEIAAVLRQTDSALHKRTEVPLGVRRSVSYWGCIRVCLARALLRAGHGCCRERNQNRQPTCDLSYVHSPLPYSEKPP